jgi:hypothetical protein
LIHPNPVKDNDNLHQFQWRNKQIEVPNESAKKRHVGHKIHVISICCVSQKEEEEEEEEDDEDEEEE